MIDLYQIINGNIYLDILFDILQNISGGGIEIQNDIVRHVIGTISFIILFSISMFHRNSGSFDSKRDGLLSWGFGMGLFRNVVLLVMSIITYISTAYHVEVRNPITQLSSYVHYFKDTDLSLFLTLFYTPIDHFLQLVSMLLISMAFVSYLIVGTHKEQQFRRYYLIFGICISFLMYVITQLIGCMSGLLNINFIICVSDYIWHSLSIILLIYPIYVIHKQPENWIINIVMLLFGFYLLYDVGKLLDLSITGSSVVFINSIRYTILNIIPLIMTWIFIKESMIRLEEQTNASRTLLDMQELFITGTSHELASPIAGMEGYLKTLDRYYKKSSPKDINEDCPRGMVCRKIPLTVTTLQDGVQHIKSILRVMKDYGHTKDYNEIKLYDINDLTQKCYNAIKFADTTKKIPKENFEYHDCSSSNNYLVYLSPYKYRQIIENIVNNSTRALEIRKPKNPYIKITLKCMGEGCIITIKDNGIGMTEDELKHCFQKRWTTFENHGGTGLGLYFVKKYLDEFQGTVHVDSKKHVGTIVRIVLPTETEIL